MSLKRRQTKTFLGGEDPTGEYNIRTEDCGNNYGQKNEVYRYRNLISEEETKSANFICFVRDHNMIRFYSTVLEF